MGRRTGRDVLAGKNVHVGQDGFEEFDDYLSDSDFDMTKEHVLRRNMQEESESKMSDDSGEENISSSANSVITRKEELQDETCRKNCLPQTDVIVSQSIPRYNNFSVSRLQHSQGEKITNRSRFGWLKSRKIGRRTGKDVIAGKRIRHDKDGFEIFDDYLSPSSGSESFLSGSSAHTQRHSQVKTMKAENRGADNSSRQSKHSPVLRDNAQSLSSNENRESGESFERQSEHKKKETDKTEKSSSVESHAKSSKDDGCKTRIRNKSPEVNTDSERVKSGVVALSMKNGVVEDIEEHKKDRQDNSKHVYRLLTEDYVNGKDLDEESRSENNSHEKEKYHLIAGEPDYPNDREKSAETSKRQTSRNSYMNDFESEFRSYCGETDKSKKVVTGFNKISGDTIPKSSGYQEMTSQSHVEKESDSELEIRNHLRIRTDLTHENDIKVSHTPVPDTGTLKSNDISENNMHVDDGRCYSETENPISDQRKKIAKLPPQTKKLHRNEGKKKKGNVSSHSEDLVSEDEDVAPSSQTGIDVAGNRSGSITKLDIPDTSKVNFDKTRKRLSYSALELSKETKKERSRVGAVNWSSEGKSTKPIKTSKSSMSFNSSRDATGTNIYEKMAKITAAAANLWNRKEELVGSRIVSAEYDGEKTHLDTKYYEPSDFVSLALVARRKSTFVRQQHYENDDHDIEKIDKAHKKRKGLKDKKSILDDKNKENTLDKYSRIKQTKINKSTPKSVGKKKSETDNDENFKTGKKLTTENVVENLKPRKKLLITHQPLNHNHAVKISQNNHYDSEIIVNDIPQQKQKRKNADKIAKQKSVDHVENKSSGIARKTGPNAEIKQKIHKSTPGYQESSTRKKSVPAAKDGCDSAVENSNDTQKQCSTTNYQNTIDIYNSSEDDNEKHDSQFTRNQTEKTDVAENSGTHKFKKQRSTGLETQLSFAGDQKYNTKKQLASKSRGIPLKGHGCETETVSNKTKEKKEKENHYNNCTEFEDREEINETLVNSVRQEELIKKKDSKHAKQRKACKQNSQRRGYTKSKTVEKSYRHIGKNFSRKTDSRKQSMSQSLRRNSKLKLLSTESHMNKYKRRNMAEVFEMDSIIDDTVSKPKKNKVADSEQDSQLTAKRRLEFQRNTSEAQVSRNIHESLIVENCSDEDENYSGVRRRPFHDKSCSTSTPDSTLRVPTNFSSGVSIREARRSELLENISSGYGNVPNIPGKLSQMDGSLTPCISKAGTPRSKGHKVSICPVESTVFGWAHNSADKISLKKRKKSKLSCLDTTLPSMNSSLKHYGEQSQPGMPHPGRKSMEYLKSRLILPEPAPPGLRRSKRTRLQPVAEYKGEEIVYSRKNAYDVEILGVKESNEVKYNRMEEEKRKRRQLLNQIRKASKKNKPGMLNRKLSVHVQLPGDAHPVDTSEISVPNPHSDDSFTLDCIATKESRSPVGPGHDKPKKDDPYLIKKMINQPIMSSGELTIKPGCEKPPQLVDNHATVFMIHYGKLLVTIHNTTSLLETGDFFWVPYGCSYSIKNLRSDCAHLFYTLLKSEVNETTNHAASQDD